MDRTILEIKIVSDPNGIEIQKEGIMQSHYYNAVPNTFSYFESS